MSKILDLIVIGAGPAGLIASLVAAEGGLSVLLVERKKQVCKITRSCCSMWINEPMTHGESIAVEPGRVVFHINDFSVEYTGDRIPLRQYIRLSPGGKKFVLENESGPVSIAFDKEDLLKGLLRRAEASGVKVASGTLCIDVMRQEEKVAVKLRDRDGETTKECRYLLLADGVNSPLGVRLGFDKERTLLGRFQVLSYFFENVSCPFPPAFMSFVGAGNLKGGLGNIYMLPKPGIRKDIYEITIGSPAGDPGTLLGKMQYFTEEGYFSSWFKHAKLINTNSAVLDFRTPVLTPVMGRTLVAGDAAAFIETYVQGALIYGRSAAKAVVGKIKEGKDFSQYINLWRDTFGYNQPGEIEKATQAYGLNAFPDSDLDYLFSLTENEKHKGFVNEFNDFERIVKALYSHIETMREEKPELAKGIENFFDAAKSESRQNLQLVDEKS